MLRFTGSRIKNPEFVINGAREVEKLRHFVKETKDFITCKIKLRRKLLLLELSAGFSKKLITFSYRLSCDGAHKACKVFRKKGFSL